LLLLKNACPNKDLASYWPTFLWPPARSISEEFSSGEAPRYKDEESASKTDPGHGPTSSGGGAGGGGSGGAGGSSTAGASASAAGGSSGHYRPDSGSGHKSDKSEKDREKKEKEREEKDIGEF